MDLEDLILLKCPHYSKETTDSMLFPTKSQWVLFFFSIQKKNPKIYVEPQKIQDS